MQGSTRQDDGKGASSEVSHNNQLLWNNVFFLEPARNKIIEYLISGPSSTSEIRTCRLVNYSWLQSVSQVLRKSKKPLFHLHLDKNNSVNEMPYVEENGKLLEQFLDAVTESWGLEENPFKITASLDFFRDENYESLTNCLSLCGSELVELDVTFPRNGGSMPFAFPEDMSLPNLHEFTVSFGTCNFGENMRRIRAPGYNRRCMAFIEAVMTASRRLVTFIMWSKNIHESFQPSNFRLLRLPPTLTELDFGQCRLRSSDLRILVRENNIPNLKSLTLLVPDEPWDNGLLFRILKNCCGTLQDLNFSGLEHDGEPKPPTFFRFPPMASLRKLETHSIHLQLQPDLPPLVDNLPVLTTLKLFHQPDYTFCRWTRSYKLGSVTDLQVALVDENEDMLSLDYFVPLEYLDLMHQLPRSFPNLKCLDFEVDGVQCTELPFIFREMKQLVRLTVRIKGTGIERVRNTDGWDALFLGVPLAVGTTLRMHPSEELVEEIDFSKMEASVRRMTELQELALRHENDSTGRTTSLISDAVFRFGFLHMVNLKRLFFSGRFKVSSEMEATWISQEGRVYTYNSFTD